MTTTSENFDNKFEIAKQKLIEEVYGDDAQNAVERAKSIVALHQKKFGKQNQIDLFSSSGRIEIIGNHTDHNGGKVLTSAVSCDVLSSVSKTDDMKVEINSVGYKPIVVDLKKLEPNENEKGTSSALVRGVADWFVKKGFKIGGFVATLQSNVPNGAGVSSSSAFEVLIAEIFNDYFNNGSVSKIEKAKASKYAENVHFGKPCGLMDQMAIAQGGINEIDFHDQENPQIVPCEWKFDDVCIFVVATGGDHSDLVSDYAGILNEMKMTAKFFGKDCLRDVDQVQFMQNLASLKKNINGRAILRAIHFFEENQRVENAVVSLCNKDEKSFFEIVNQSGKSSGALLQNLYTPSDINQMIPLGIEISRRIEGVKAVRVHGGGFAGTIIAFVEKAKANDYESAMKNVFGERNVIKLFVRKAGATKIATLEGVC